eukprot:2707347-Amphidinium_carterae.1
MSLVSDCLGNRQRKNRRLPSEEWCIRKHPSALDPIFVSLDMKTSCSVWIVTGLPSSPGSVSGRPTTPAAVAARATGSHTNAAPGRPDQRAYWPIFRLSQRTPD